MNEAVKIAFKKGEIPREDLSKILIVQRIGVCMFDAVEILEVRLAYYCLGFILNAS